MEKHWTVGHILVICVFLIQIIWISARSLSIERTCSYGNMTISPGKRFKPEPCMTCHCSRHGGRVTCSVKDCQKEVNCLKFDKMFKSCCPKCLEYGCAHTDGKIYQKGSIIVETECISCYCPDNGGETLCDVTPCEPLACANAIKRPGECCPYCPNDSTMEWSRSHRLK
ncbi:hypothetical protein LOTGIDRAFT_232415 [Lottia gigantea]|uniref:VWFC domain-containing protein n=1 Tax=Lottia gigantea TaxID=225164 RepID=V4AKQ4_LOTGI|nr:hypothetical protein LOTGIDRAFT_232415 [Lottia gigantea]ESO94151.1 hypothetical protein LOTGIDRAFT_232415 [Lottia gigantea]